MLYAAWFTKNILPEDGRIIVAETCRRLYKYSCAVVGFINKFVKLVHSFLRARQVLGKSKWWMNSAPTFILVLVILLI
jgi:hypothetical protein